ncbi:MAG: dihydroorotate dehydrogenase-like protein [Spirochaetales bacterium]|nr:dihydroorotate dehydrogenase-like protein [Spirochaetales bacterium]
MSDLSVNYLGLDLDNPVIAGASGLTSNLTTIKNIEDAGAGAIVCKSLFEEEIQLEAMKLRKELSEYNEIHAEMITTHPNLREKGPEQHLFWLRKTKEAVSIPVIASLNAVNENTWIEYAKLIEQTGVDALELNISSLSSFHLESSEFIEQAQLDLLARIKNKLKIPVSVKIGPLYTNIANFVMRADQSGIAGFVLFNRFFRADIDIDHNEMVYPFTFSQSADSLLPLTYAGILFGKVSGSICGSTGILNAQDAVKLILAGADAVQVVTTLYRNGTSHITTILDGIREWMETRGYGKIDDFKGRMSRETLSKKDSRAYRRSQYIKMLMQPPEVLAEQIY